MENSHQMEIRFRPYSIKFLMFLIGLSFVMASSIYWKELSGRIGVSFLNTFVWQILIWTPWVFALFIVERVSETMEGISKPIKILYFAMLYFLLIVLHWSLFFAVSAWVSPLLGMPETRFGVYRYFFIFWIMIDVVLLWAISMRLGIPKIVEDPIENIENDEKNVFVVKKGNSTILIQPDEIKWVSAEDYYAKLHTEQGGFLIRKPLKVLMRELSNEKFIQVHRSTIVNVGQVSEAKKSEDGNHILILKDGAERAVSRNGLKRLKAVIS